MSTATADVEPVPSDAPQVDPENPEVAKDAKPTEDDKPKPKPMVGCCSMYRFANTWEMTQVTIAVIASLAMGAIMPLFSIVFGDILDDLATSTDVTSTVIPFVLFYVYIAFGAWFLSFLSHGLLNATAERMTSRIRYRFFRALLRNDMDYHDLHEAGGEVAARLGADCDAVKEGLGIKLAESITAVATFFTGVSIAFSIRPDAWKLALVITACLPFMIVAMGVMGYMMKSRATLSANLTAEASGAASEALRNIRIVMSYGGYDVEVERYKAKLEHARDTDASSGRVQGATVGFMLFSMFATYAIGLFYGAVLIQENRDAHPQCTFDPTGPECFSGGDVITIFFAMVIGGGAIARLAPGLTALATARAIAFTLYETIDAVPAKTALPDVGAAEPGKVLPAPTGNMSLRGVSFAYPSRPEQTVLHDINIDIPAGKTVALVGPSGSGKSTIAQLVQRLYDPTTGTVTFDGVDVKELQVQWLRDQQGVVSQQPVLFAASVKENILAGAPLSVRDDYGDDQIAGAAKIALAHGFIKALPDGYDTDVGASGGLLSGGQKQRVSIARAILHSRPMQIWDEATSALDSTNEAAVQAALDNLAATPGHSTPSRLIIAHRLSTIRGADLICVLDEGRIVERGTHEELLADANSLYSKLWGMQKLMEDGGGAAAAPEPTAPALAAPSLSRAVSAASDAGHVVVQVGGEEEVDTKNMTPEQKAAAALAALAALDETAEGADKALTEWKKTLPNVPFARVWEYQSPEKWYLFGGFFFAAIAGCIMPTFAIVLSTILNVFYETDADTLREESLFNMALFFGIAIAGFIANSGTIGLLSYTGGFMTTRLRMDAYRSVLKQGAEFFDRPENSAGRVVGRLAKDAQAVKAITGINLSMMIQQIASMALALVVAFLASWRVALVVLAIIPLLGASAAVNFKVRSGFESSSMKESKELSHLATEAIVNLRTVQSLGLERAMLLRFHSSQDATDAKAVRSAYIAGVTSGFAMFVLFATYALLFYVGSIWINDGVLTFPDLLQAMFVLIFAAQGLGQTSAFTVDSATADAAKRSLFQLIDMKPTIDPTDTTLAVPPALANATIGHSLRLKGVNFTYPVRPENPVLKGADLDIPAGKTVAIVGESGSGKSTVVQLLQRFYDPQGGAVEIDGVDIKTLPVSWLRSRFGWVPQEPRLFADSVAYNVGYGLLPDKLAPHAGVTLEAQEAAGKPGADPAVIPPSFHLPPAIPTAAEIANAAGFIGGLSYKYATHVGSEGSQLSGGQRQRVALARCLVREPAVMLLDEATSALDSQSEQVVQESIDAVLAAAAGTRTTVVIAHRLSTIKKADVVVVLQQGRVVETGTHDELVAAKGVYTAMVAAQSGVTVEAAAGGAAGGDQN